MKILRLVMACAPISLVTSTAGFAQHVQTDSDHQANFAQYKTYSLQKSNLTLLWWIRRIKNAETPLGYGLVRRLLLTSSSF
jgi:hypothetical protein